jgi:protein Mpv17
LRCVTQALFPFQQWWVVPAKVAFDQTVWSAIWNTIYIVVLGLLRFDSLDNIYGEIMSTFLRFNMYFETKGVFVS